MGRARSPSRSRWRIRSCPRTLVDHLLVRGAVHHDHLVEAVDERVRWHQLAGLAEGPLVGHVSEQHLLIRGEAENVPRRLRLLGGHLVLTEERGGGPGQGLAHRLREARPGDPLLHAVEHDGLRHVVARERRLRPGRQTGRLAVAADRGARPRRGGARRRRSRASRRAQTLGRRWTRG